MDECLFCKIIEGVIPSKKVYEDENVYAFCDINPVAPVHVLIVPKKHIPGTNDISREDDGLLGNMFEAARKIAKDTGVSEDGYRIVFNCGENGGQSVPHLHMHLIGGKKLGWG